MLTGSHCRVCLLCIRSRQAGLPQNSARLQPGLSCPCNGVLQPPSRPHRPCPQPLELGQKQLTKECAVGEWGGVTQKSLMWTQLQPSRMKNRWPGKRVRASANPVCGLTCTARCRSQFHTNGVVWAHFAHARAHPHPHPRPHTPLVLSTLKRRSTQDSEILHWGQTWGMPLLGNECW